METFPLLVTDFYRYSFDNDFQCLKHVKTHVYDTGTVNFLLFRTEIGSDELHFQLSKLRSNSFSVAENSTCLSMFLKTVLPDGVDPSCSSSVNRIFMVEINDLSIIFCEGKPNYFTVSSLDYAFKQQVIYIQPPFNTYFSLSDFTDYSSWISTATQSTNDFDVILLNPPWLDISLCDILNLNVSLLQLTGFCFIWVTNPTLMPILRWLTNHDYVLVDELVYLRPPTTSFSGYYLQHSFDICVIAMKGDPVSIEFPKHVCGQFDSVITPFSSHFIKPTLLYSVIEHLVPNGSKLELFSTFSTLRSFWTFCEYYSFGGGGMS